MIWKIYSSTIEMNGTPPPGMLCVVLVTPSDISGSEKGDKSDKGPGKTLTRRETEETGIVTAERRWINGDPIRVAQRRYWRVFSQSHSTRRHSMKRKGGKFKSNTITMIAQHTNVLVVLSQMSGQERLMAQQGICCQYRSQEDLEL